jgi:hypothetical protein
LEEKVECFDEPLLASGGRGKYHPPVVAVQSNSQKRVNQSHGQRTHSRVIFPILAGDQ